VADSVEALIANLATQHGTTVRQLRSKKRNRHLVWVRSRVAHALRAAPYSFSTPVIGSLLGGRDHSTVLNLLSRYPNGSDPRRDTKRGK
jgi:chromosomal replication initiation ATPase DnaA